MCALRCFARLAVFASVVGSLKAVLAQQWQVVYHTDFSEDPGWVTSAPQCRVRQP